jgi:hypothetical protein
MKTHTALALLFLAALLLAGWPQEELRAQHPACRGQPADVEHPGRNHDLALAEVGR